MATPAVSHRPRPPAGSDRSEGHSLGIRSLLMMPALILSFLLSFMVQVWILGFKGLDGSEPMSQQGAVGWLSFAVGMAIFLAPLAVGVFLGSRARRLGASGLGLAGILVNGVLFIGLLVSLFISTLMQ